ncbi:hypothetical protein ABPG75_001976 [Micractinium tetrahymenae]
MQRRGFWSSLFGTGPAHDRFSLEELQYLHTTLLRNPVVNDSNREAVVEALRSIAELVIWGDQHDSSMVEYFLTENLLGHFNQILQQRSNRRGNVAMQVLQTLSILIQNLRNQQTVYYLFSNNHINEIVSMRFDFDDDEVLGYFVNLLKTISLKLNETTVQFFFHAGGPPGGGRGSGGASPGASRPASFPLYTESIKFVNHRDPMVRTAVKTLTLNVYGIPLPAVQQFVTSRPASAYFVELATFIGEQCQVLDRLLSSWDVASPQAQGSVETCLAEVEDLLSYCNDVLATGVEPLQELLLDCLWQAFVGPVLFWPLIQEDVAVQHIAALTLGSALVGAGSSAAGALAGAAGSGSGPGGRGGPAEAAAGAQQALQRGTVGPLCSLYIFERLFLAVTDPQLLTLLVSALLGGGPGSAGASLAGSRPGSRPGSPGDGPPSRSQQAAAGVAAAAAARWQIPPGLLARLQYSPAAYRQALLGMLRGSDAQVAAAAVRVLASLLRNRAVSEEQLELIGKLGLLPQRRRKQRQLLKALVGDSPLNSHMLEPSAAAEVEAEESADAAFSDVVSALLGLLSSDLMPPLSLRTVGWLLNQLLAVGKGGAVLSPGQRQALAQAAGRHRAALRQQLQGRWADALAPLVAAEWRRCREDVLRAGPGSVHVAVQTWMQAVLVQELRWQQGATAGGASVPDAAAVAAKHAYLTVQGAVAVLQLQQVLCEGEVPLDPPCPPVSDADVRRGEVREQAQIALAQSQRMHCAVCFTRGQERQAYFAVEGLPAHMKAGQAADLSLLKPSVLQQVAASAPVLLVADPGTKPETGLVLSVAPLMGALPQVDAKHARWLHVKVRPPLRGLLKVLQGSHPGNALLNMQRHLVSGHWVLAFPDADRAASAAQHCEEWAHKMRAVYCQLLHPLLHDGGEGGSGVSACGGQAPLPGTADGKQD